MTVPALLPLRQDFLGRLRAARALAFPFFRGVAHSLAMSGAPTEFEGHRPYTPGDDTRWIDWNLFARLEELYVKVFKVEEEVEVLLMVDSSLSMTRSPGVKHEVASAASAALAYLAFLTSHPVTVIRYSDKALDTIGPDRHIQAFPGFGEFLLSDVQGKGTDLRKSLAPFLLHHRRPVTVVVISDGFQREPLEGVVGAFQGMGERRIIFLRVEDHGDLHPPLRGNLLVRDVESSESRTILSDRTLEKQLHRRIADYFKKLEKNLRRAGCESFVFPVDAPFEETFVTMLRSFLPDHMKAAAP